VLWAISGQRSTATHPGDPAPAGTDRAAPGSYLAPPNGVASPDVAAPAPTWAEQTEAERAAHVAAPVTRWGAAIPAPDADGVVQLDMTFRETPDRYLPALLENARTDSNERVRAFSTRTLGKLARADLAPAFRQLLADASPYVRQNAAWALGELASVPE